MIKKIFLLILFVLGHLTFASWSIEQSDANALTLLWTAETNESTSDMHKAFALPGGSVNGTVDVLETVNLPQQKTTSEEPLLTLSPPQQYRDLQVSSLTLHRKVKQGEKIVLLLKARIHLQFLPNGKFRSVFAAPADNPAEIFLQNWIMNYAQSRNFRSVANNMLAKKSTGSGQGFSSTLALPTERLIVETQDENIEVITYADLKSKGLPLNKIDPRSMRLTRNGLEIPLYIQGEDDGQWNEGDYLEFIGARAQGLGAATTNSTYLSPYTNHATFLLTWGNGLGLRAPATPVASDANEILQPGSKAIPTQHTVHLHVEEDNEILRTGSTAIQDIQDLGNQVKEEALSDFWFWKNQGVDKDAIDIEFNCPYAPYKDGLPTNDNSNLYVTIALKGITNNFKADPDHHLKFLLNSHDITVANVGSNEARWEGQAAYVWKSQKLSPTFLKEGKNILTIQKINDIRTNEGQLIELQDAYLNYMEFDFPATFSASQNQLHFSNDFHDSLGLTRFTLQNITADKISLWDTQGRKLTGYNILANAKGGTLSFKDSLFHATKFILSAWENREKPLIHLDTLPNLLHPTQGADYIVITDKRLFGNALDSLLAIRTAQGLRCQVVTMQHIYQSFGNGETDPAALRRFLEYAFQNWPRPAPTYVLLLGETSQWYDKISGAFQQNLVPTHLVNIQGWGIAANDDYFAKVSGDDDLPDLLIGRIPVANKLDLSHVIRKILTLEKRNSGSWQNKSLLISGYEAGFAQTNYVLQTLAVDHDREFSRIDLYPQSPYYKSNTARQNFYQQMDSGFAWVNFYGHGGGSVWSDAGLLNIEALVGDSLKGNYPISFVSSITCLTGYFEDVSARSLGEELLRYPKGGAASFYGASGYISSKAGEALSQEILEAAFASGTHSVGSIVQQAEAMVQLPFGGNFTPILEEFNLLGDPALTLQTAKAEGELILKPQALNGKNTLSIQGQNLAFADGQGLVSIYLDDSLESNTQVTLKNNAFSLEHSLTNFPQGFRKGKVVLVTWNNTRTVTTSALFSTLDWLIDSVFTIPNNPKMGDSVTVGFRLKTAYSQITFKSGIITFAIDNKNDLKNSTDITLQSDDQKIYTSFQKIFLQTSRSDLLTPQLILKFRMALAGSMDSNSVAQPINNLDSRVYALPIQLPPDLAFLHPAISLPIQNTLGIWLHFKNMGFGHDSDFQAILTSGSSAKTKDTLIYAKKLNLGQSDSLFFPLTDSALRMPIHAELKSLHDQEVNLGNNSSDTIFTIQTFLFSNLNDTLKLPFSLPNNPIFLSLNYVPSNPLRIFIQPMYNLSLPAYLKPWDNPLTAWSIQMSSQNLTNDSALLKLSEFWTPLLLNKLNVQSKTFNNAQRPDWHFRTFADNTWLKLDSLASVGIASASFFRNGIYALLLNQDIQVPGIQLSSHGQVLLPDDYVPRNTPIDIVLQDNYGIDNILHKPILISAKQKIDSTSAVFETDKAMTPLLHLRFLPKQKIAVDTLTFTIFDISGNITKKSITYRLGDALTLQNLGSYPNPFADSATFVYSLTDFCDKVDLKIYSRAGRLVKALEEHNVVGYREVVWDGRDGSGHNIANGLYYLKVTAYNSDKEVSRIFKLFKKQRK